MKKEDMRKLFLSKVEEMVTAYNEGMYYNRKNVMSILWDSVKVVAPTLPVVYKMQYRSLNLSPLVYWIQRNITVICGDNLL
ncbi:hypothetical protein [Aeromonas phage 4L372D]|uniref:Uncharacterized protein n=1 Tax=Aeromonas phage 4L372D TaxID=2588518 RepID=A0A5B9N2Y2_9CAUD|nr:hypothetical protein HWC27_gp003 [Aeromonas phage 4L372D]QEG08467.1 hypothetical protein [Aeromonas phage 4L372D]